MLLLQMQAKELRVEKLCAMLCPYSTVLLLSNGTLSFRAKTDSASPFISVSINSKSYS